MLRQYHQFWKFETDAKGRQRWLFTQPLADMNWESADGKSFLLAMQKEFIFDKRQNPNSADLIYRQAKHNPENKPHSQSGKNSHERAVDYYTTVQAESGHFPGDYGGPHFLTPGLVIASYVTQSPLPLPYQVLIEQYFLNHQNDDGGWGLHIEGSSTMFGTVLQYVALRLLGEEPSKLHMVKAREWILKNGGATGIPSWGKFYLSVLGVYDWEGCNSLFPEMWLFPEGLPFHPSRYWCHARMVYLPMAYCYGLKVKATASPLTEEIKTEIYRQKYETINWKKARYDCADTDMYYRPSQLLKTLNIFTNTYEKIRLRFLRKKATSFVLDYINAEDDQTNYIDIGPVNQVVNSLAVWHAYGKESEQFKKHYDRWFDYLWLAEDGMKMNGYNGSQFWDTAFAVQAFLENRNAASDDSVRKAYRYIDVSQVKEEVRQQKKFYRHMSVGGFPFSNVDHGWPITDCTAEGLKTALLVAKTGVVTENLIPDTRLKQAADVILSLQNKDGGWASYELTRGPQWLELLNPSEIFGNIMIDYSYTECTSACVQALLAFKKTFPGYRTSEVEKTIDHGIQFILSQQKGDGSWYGSWAVCFTYGTWFAVEALTKWKEETKKTGPSLLNELARVQHALDKAVEFLHSKQNPDGGWGESIESCLRKEYVPHNSSQIVNTSWAVLSLMAIGDNNREVIDRGITLIQSRQTSSGDFPQEGICGIFNHSCGISYTAYRNVFPIWALGRYLNKYGSKKAEKHDLKPQPSA